LLPVLFFFVSLAVITITFFFSYVCHELVSHETASSSAECSRDKLPFSFVRGQDSTMWNSYLTSVNKLPHARSASVLYHDVLLLAYVFLVVCLASLREDS